MCYNNGGVTVNLTSGGSGYTSSPTVVFTGGGGTVAGSLAQIDPVAGTVTNIVVTNSWGFATAPTITLTGGGGSGAAATATVTAAGVGALATLTETNITTGKWTLSVSGGNTFTMTSPSGLTTNVVLDPTVAALFPAPWWRISAASRATLPAPASPVFSRISRSRARPLRLMTRSERCHPEHQHLGGTG